MKSIYYYIYHALCTFYLCNNVLNLHLLDFQLKLCQPSRRFRLFGPCRIGFFLILSLRILPTNRRCQSLLFGFVIHACGKFFLMYTRPDQKFRNFRAPKCVGRLILWRLEPSIYAFRASKVVKCSVGKGWEMDGNYCLFILGMNDTFFRTQLTVFSLETKQV